MSHDAGQPLRLWGWIVMPLLLTLLAAVVFATPFRVFGLRLPEPVWPMVLAFAWPVIRPSIATPFALLLAGLFLDLLWGAALGQWTLALLVVYAATLFSRSLMIGQGVVVVGLWYVGMTLLLFAAMQTLTMFDLRAAAGAASVGLQALATAALFPFAHRLIEAFEDAGARVR